MSQLNKVLDGSLQNKKILIELMILIVNIIFLSIFIYLVYIRLFILISWFIFGIIYIIYGIKTKKVLLATFINKESINEVSLLKLIYDQLLPLVNIIALLYTLFLIFVDPINGIYEIPIEKQLEVEQYNNNLILFFTIFNVLYIASHIIYIIYLGQKERANKNLPE